MHRERSAATCLGMGIVAASLAMLVGGCTSRPWFDPVPRGHAHNDYLHARPLLDALRAGFASVEVDVFLRDGELLVGHDEWMLRRDRTLRRLYLDRLRERVQQNGGSVHGDGLPFLLLVDIKRDGESVLRALDEVLPEYAPMLTRFLGDQIEPGAVTIVLSGDRPRAAVAARPTRYVAIDGRIQDLDDGTNVALVPLVSEAWSRHFEWDAVDEMPQPERAALCALVMRARKQGCMLRFWGAPDRPLAWAALRELGVTWINTDRLRDYAAWSAEQPDRR